MRPTFARFVEILRASKRKNLTVMSNSVIACVVGLGVVLDSHMPLR